MGRQFVSIIGMSKQTATAGIQTLLSFIGTLDAGTIYMAHRANVDLPCTSGGGCDLVNSSPWASLWGVPVSLIGAGAYVVLLFCSILRLTTDSERLAYRINVAMTVMALAGACYSWYLQYVAAVIIQGFCIWCRVSAITITLIFLTSLIGWLLTRSAPHKAPA